jgi:hypothetical protein
MMECLQLEESVIPCIRHHGGELAKCYLVFCLDCGKDIVRDCEREGGIE